jgi:hypothetical protein
MKRIAIVAGSLALAMAVGTSGQASAAEPTYVSAGAGGVYPAGTSFSGVDVQGLQLAVGSEVGSDGSGLGNFTAVLLGVSVTGEVRPISVQGQVTAGVRNAVNVAVLTGTASLDLADGLPPAPDIPFTATLVGDPATRQGTVALVIGSAQLPTLTLNEGSLSIQTVPANPAAAGTEVAQAQ